jgi:hypothetical protein
MNGLRGRLRRLERQVGRPPFTLDLENMSDAELFRLAGLPPSPSQQEIHALIAALEEDLAQTAPSLEVGKAPG